jgi:hypothetical protein
MVTFIEQAFDGVKANQLGGMMYLIRLGFRGVWIERGTVLGGMNPLP